MSDSTLPRRPRTEYEQARGKSRTVLVDRLDWESNDIRDTSKAAQRWEEATDWNGNNYISRATGSQWEHEALYRSAKGRYYVVSWSQWQGSGPGQAWWLSPREAALWLTSNDHEIPPDLEAFAAEVIE